jgi:peptidoglycan/LPS O-acetylase OafA/YrhL
MPHLFTQPPQSGGLPGLSMSVPNPASDTRVSELDGLRGLAILLVLLWHYVQNQLHPDPGTALAAVKLVLGSAWSGVDLFFVLSGYLIAGILIEQRAAQNYFSVFYLRRACRILPLYGLFLGLFALGVWLTRGQQDVIAHLFQRDAVPLWSYPLFAQNIAMAAHNAQGPAWLAVTWSLAVEEQFYLLLPLIVRLVPVARLPWVLLWFIAAAVWLRVMEPGLSAYINTPWRADSLLLGALLAWVSRQPGFPAWRTRNLTWLYGALALLLGGVLYATLTRRIALGGALTHLWLSVFYACLLTVVLADRAGWLARGLRARTLTWLGTISYGVYLLHTGISGLVHGLWRGLRPAMDIWADVPVTLTALLLTLSLAQASFLWFERPITRYGHRFRYGQVV